MTPFGMINVQLNERMGATLMSMLFGLKVASNNLNQKIQMETVAVEQAKDFKQFETFFDKRYKKTTEFFNKPMESNSMPIAKRSQLKEANQSLNLMMKNKDRINNYTNKVMQMKQIAMWKGVKR